jgi:ribonuclease P protein component
VTIRPARGRRGVLRQPSQFEAVLSSGARLSSRNFVVRVLANDADEPRLGMIAGKKAAVRAVDRNRAKRLIRETFRAAAPRLTALDVTVQLRSNLRSVENGVVRAELQSLFNTLVRRCTAPDAIARAESAPRSSSDRQ